MKKEFVSEINANEIYSVPKMARILMVSPETLYNKVRAKEIPYFKCSERSEVRFAGWHIKSWIDGLIVQPKEGDE